MKNKLKLSAIILSAGFSSRMGALKPLLKLGDKTALEVLINTYKLCGIEDIIVVTGHRAEEIMGSLKQLDVNWAVNKNYKEGMYSSVKTGVNKLQEDSQGFFLNPVDIPLIKAATIESLKTEFSKGQKDIIFPVFNGERVHPPLISNIFKKYILEDTSSCGLGKLLEKYGKNSGEIPVIDWGASKDMDTAQDYEELKKYYTSAYIPNMEECHAIWRSCNLHENIIEHCRAVADAACSIGRMLQNKGYKLDQDIIKYASLLHDIGRMGKNHAEAGARILEELGYKEIADIVCVHMDMSSDIRNSNEITEKEIVYLADKCVSGKDIVDLGEKFRRAKERYGDNPEAAKNIELRFQNCRVIIDKIEKITGEDFSI